MSARTKKPTYSRRQKAHAKELLREIARLADQMNKLGEDSPYGEVRDCRSAYSSMVGQIGMWAPCILSMIEGGES